MQNFTTPELLSDNKVFSGQWLQIHSQRLKLADGKEISVEILRFPDIALIVPLLDKQVILVKQYRYAIQREIWELPAGKIDPDETPEESAIRELTEETGYKSDHLTKIGELLLSPHNSTETTHIFIAQYLKKDTCQLEIGEMIEPSFFTFAQVKSMVKKREIKDAKTIAALQLAEII